jgi:four helix bundle protein
MTNKMELDELIDFISSFDLASPDWQNVPKLFSKTHPNTISSSLIPKFLSMKTMFELTFNRDLKTESEQKLHGGYRKLEAFKQAEIVYDFTMEFIKTYRSNKSYKTYITYKTCEQIEGAARSGKQNIAEGSQRASISPSTELQLVDVARASFEELLHDFQDFLRNNYLSLWEKDDPRSLAIRKMAYKTDKTYMTYKSYMSYPEGAANCAICLIHQVNYLLDRDSWRR